MKKLAVLCVLGLVLIASCKKKDIITTQIIHGQIFNLSTDSGLANVTIYFEENNNLIARTISGANGMFSLPNVQIHSSGDYAYNFVIPEIEGIYADAFGDIDKSTLNQPQIISIIGLFNTWSLYFPNTLFTANDTFVLTLQQNTYHKTLATGNWQSITNCPCSITAPTHSLSGLSFWAMGWWQVTYNKTTNGVHTIKTDSFYVGWKANITDTIPW